MPTISPKRRRKIEQLDRQRCAYCHTTQMISSAQMHVEHITPLAKDGTSAEDNLCLSCAWCNSYKGIKTHALDPLTQQDAPLFHPRCQSWHEHFTWDPDGIMIIGLTATGRATVNALHLNNEFILPSRRLWRSAGWHPPETD